MKKSNILFIVTMWGLLVFVGYNVLTVGATISKDELRKMTFINDDLDDYGLKELAIEQSCKDNDGEWKDNNWCKFDKVDGEDEVEFEHQLNDRGLDYYYNDKEYLGEEWSKYQNEKYEKSQKGTEEYQKYVAQQEEKAAQEDAICDNEDADTTNVKLCMSDRRQQQFEHNYDKESCEQVNGDWNKKKGSGCTFYEDEQQDILDAAEEQRKIIDGGEQKALAEIAEYNTAQAQKQQGEPEVIGDWGNTVVSDEEQQKVKYEQLADTDDNIHEIAKEIVEEEEQESNDDEESADDDSNEGGQGGEESSDDSESEDEGQEEEESNEEEE